LTATLNFRKYDHLERAGHNEVLDLDLGKVYVFPKLDGTNASVWFDGESICAGSRNRKLSLESDNAGFYEWVLSDDPKAVQIREYLQAHPRLILYGEWLVPHTLKTYREEAWRRFYVFDVYDTETSQYLSYETYSGELIRRGIDVIEPLCTAQNPSHDQLNTLVEQNTYLIADGAGVGEGIVCKNYAWKNAHGRQPWMKVVRNSFKEANKRAFGAPDMKGQKLVEQEIVNEFVTPHLVGKTRAKVVLDVANAANVDTSSPNFQHEVEANYRSRVIPQLLGRVFHDLVEEECWTFVKKFKNPTVDFRKLMQLTNQRVKELAQDLF